MNDMIIPMEHYLVVSTILFFAGIYGFIARKNLLAVLISIELILNSVEINFSVFNRYLYPDQMEGMFFSLFGIAISAAETAIAIAIMINIYRNLNNIDVRHIDKLNG
jgi:NADH-quinone oxidoreductase subunit K